MGKSEEERPDTYLLPPEDVVADDYINALVALGRYDLFDVSRINNFKDLTTEFTAAGEELKKVVLTSGKIHDIYDEEGNIYGGLYIMEKSIKGVEIKATLYNEEEIIDIRKTNVAKKHEQILWLMLPTNGDFSNMTCGGLEQNPLTGKVTRYFPSIEPGNPRVQQGFAGVLLNGLKDVLSIARLPSVLHPDLRRI